MNCKVYRAGKLGVAAIISRKQKGEKMRKRRSMNKNMKKIKK